MTHSGESWRLGHRPALDGLRGIAILLVIACHALLPGMSGGGVVGVTIFFTLSGFLITALLLERDEGHRELGRFYGRRARRLLPALALFLAVTATLGALGVVSAAFFPVRELPSVIFYVANLRLLAGGHLGGWGHTWSLAVEEQFYLVWPIVLILVRRRWSISGVMLVAIVGAASATAFRTWLLLGAGVSVTDVYFRSETHADALLIGAALAAALHARVLSPPMRSWVPAVGSAALVGAMALSLAASQFRQDLVVFPAVAALTAVTILSAVGSGVGWLSASWLRYVGRRSYALYLWNLPVFWLILGHAKSAVIAVPVALALTFAAAEVSWRLVERPSQRLGRASGSDLKDHVVRAG